MDIKDKLVLRPFKSIGVFTDSNAQYLYNAGTRLFLASSCGHSFKTFTIPELKISLQGPHFEGKVRAIQGFNEFLFVAVKDKVYKMRHYHVLGEMQMPAKIRCMLLIGNQLAVIDEENTLKIFDHHSKECTATVQLDFQVDSIVHPPTYLNKLLFVGPTAVELWNVNTMKKIYSYETGIFKQWAPENSNVELCLCEPSPVLNVAAFAFSDGRIVMHDLKKDKSVLSFKVNNKPICLAFSKVDMPLLAVGDEKGNILIWDLNEKKMFASLKGYFKSAVTSLNFLPNEQIFIAASGRDNSVLQFRYEEYEENKFAVFRRREGVSNALSKVRFADDLHIFASSSRGESELRDISLVNECMSTQFSTKEQSKTKLKRKHIYTEQNAASTIPEILDFSFSMNRASDWANVLTSHKESDKPCIWSSEDHSIVKKELGIFASRSAKEQNLQLTSVFVSRCGNFGVIGFDNGSVVKINMQSGAHQRVFSGAHTASITSVLVNHYNKYLITGDNAGKMVIWDFYSGTKLKEHDFINESKITGQTGTPLRIVFLAGSNYSHHFLVALSDNSLEMWDMLTLKRGRRFLGHTHTLLDACFTHDNKYVFSSSLDSTLKIYDVAQNALIANLVLDKPIVSLDASPNGDFLITVFANSKEINLWHNLVDILPWTSPLPREVAFVSPIKRTDIEDRKRYYLNDYIKQEEEEIEEQMLLEGKTDYGLASSALLDNSNIIRFTALEEGKWLSLIHLDEIKERNKLENTEEMDFKMPFFLDFSKKDEVRNQLKQEFTDKISEQSKIIRDKRDKYMAELGSSIQRLFAERSPETTEAETANDHVTFLEELKKLTPSQADYELRQALFGNANQSIDRALGFFNRLFDSTDELDLKNAYFSRMIKISGDEMLRDPSFKEVLLEIRRKIKSTWQQLLDKQYMISSMAEHFTRIPI